jgi:hypothetical protein
MSLWPSSTLPAFVTSCHLVQQKYANAAEKTPSPSLAHKKKLYHDEETNMYLQKQVNVY